MTAAFSTIPPKRAVLCILDGWGLAPPGPDNAIALARTPTMDRLTAEGPAARLQASQSDVGLPRGQMGNSEVGHMNLGAGRIVAQDLPRIDAAIASGELARRPALQDFIKRLKDGGGAAHLLGLLSPGGVHAHQEHIAALARIFSDAGITVYVHAFLDGRDCPPRSAGEYLQYLSQNAPRAILASLSGRRYAMDRDGNWDRIEPAFRAIAEGKGPRFEDTATAVQRAYDAGLSDEFVPPCVFGDYRGFRPGDGLLMANFRADRARQILSALLEPDFAEFPRPPLRPAAALGMVCYSDRLDRLMPALTPPELPENGLGQVVSDHGLRQLRIAETEKYAHVTFFFNGGREKPFPGEERILTPSPKTASHDLQPEMSAGELTDKLTKAVAGREFALIVANYANVDMVGHSGLIEPTVKAVETVDACLGRLVRAAEATQTALLIVADHGNAEMMRNAATGQPHTAHTRNPVPVILAGARNGAVALADGRLADVAPTMLELLDLPIPAEMTGKSLLRYAKTHENA